jgi:hypothetical protein
MGVSFFSASLHSILGLISMGGASDKTDVSRRFSVLKQFLADSKKLLEETQAILTIVGDADPTHEQVLKLFRPVHSLKGIASMVEEGKPMMNAFHQLEASLPPLLPIHKNQTHTQSVNWKAQAKKTILWTREYLNLLNHKLDLWKKLGAEQGEDHGLVVRCEQGSWVWIPITSVTGMVEAKSNDINATDGIGFEYQNHEFTIWAVELAAVCSRVEATHRFEAIMIKDWISHQEVARAA